MRHLLNDLASESKHLCPLPCTEVHYEAKDSVVYGKVEGRELQSRVFVYYTSNVVRTTREVPVYNVARYEC